MTDERFPEDFEKREKCHSCHRTSYDVQRRLTLSDQPLLCDECHADPSETGAYGGVIS